METIRGKRTRDRYRGLKNDIRTKEVKKGRTDGGTTQSNRRILRCEYFLTMAKDKN